LNVFLWGKDKECFLGMGMGVDDGRTMGGRWADDGRTMGFFLCFRVWLSVGWGERVMGFLWKFGLKI